MTETNIAVLFARDPLELTRSDIDNIIAELRKRRKTFGTAPTPVAKRETKKAKLVEGLDDVEIKL